MRVWGILGRSPSVSSRAKAKRDKSPRLTHEQFVQIGRGRKAGGNVLVDAPTSTASPPKVSAR
jgi:hypothetical protein